MASERASLSRSFISNRQNKVHVLLVDGNELHRTALLDLLVLCNYEVTSVDNVQVAYEEAYALMEDLDLVLVDVMEDKTGLKLVQSIVDNPNLSHIPVVVMVPEETPGLRTHIRKKGATDVVVKPLRVQVIRQLARHVFRDSPLNDKSPHSSAFDSLASEYQRIRHLGRGGSGHVSLIKRLADGKLFALKQISLENVDETERKAAQNEVALMQVLESPVIVRYYDSFVDRATLNILMEYCEGGNLGDKIERARLANTRFEEDQVLHMFAQVVVAVMLMHGKNILHRDINTHNIFLTKDGHLKIGDMGISKRLSASTVYAKTTCGTPFIMSPEVCCLENYGPKADIWSLGCTLYELVMLKKPFSHETLMGMIDRICVGSYDAIPKTVKPCIRILILTMLHQDPSCRPSVWDLARMPLVKAHIDKLAEELNMREFVDELIAMEQSDTPTKRVKEGFDLPSLTVESDGLTSLAEIIRSSISICDRRTGFFTKTYNCFQGNELVDWFVLQLGVGRSRALAIGQELIDLHLIDCCNGSRPVLCDEKKALYRFKQDKPNGYKFSCFPPSQVTAHETSMNIRKSSGGITATGNALQP
eukprot:GILJ01002423.1.p1 GENE.GILJ01002423.1~~GILJ01002423.1.p1  ORF type:complete len:590 (-),score=78.69 GILJ01002423.1:204-1973(-)